MFAHARRRLTLAYIAMFAVVMGIFSAAFLILIAIALEPDFDLAPDTSTEEAAQIAYDAAVARIGVALVVADGVAIAFIGVGAWVLAARTLRPIRDAHERQRRFVSDASHEMRTPLTAIRATTENALRSSAPAEELHAALQTIGVASAELTTLTSDLLTLAQGDDLLARQAVQRFDLSVVVSERLALRVAAGQAMPVKSSFKADLEVTGNPDEVGRICDNLVDNAFRYGGPGVRVSVATRLSDRSAVLEVSDDGHGIAVADQQHIFEPFFRVRADAEAPSGTGLGLAIVETLARRNGGRVTVDSEPARGTVFRLQLPLTT